MKRAFVMGTTGEVAIAIIPPRGFEVTLDLGIPQMPQFKLKVPYEAPDVPEKNVNALAYLAAEAITNEAINYLRGEGFEESVCEAVRNTVLKTFKEISGDSEVGISDVLILFEEKFNLPQEFAQLVRDKIVTAAPIKKLPKHFELKLEHPSRNDRNQDAMKAIRKFRSQTMKRQPFPLWIILYDNNGKPQGVARIDNNKRVLRF
jgi:hypothetical protein